MSKGKKASVVGHDPHKIKMNAKKAKRENDRVNAQYQDPALREYGHKYMSAQSGRFGTNNGHAQRHRRAREAGDIGNIMAERRRMREDGTLL